MSFTATIAGYPRIGKNRELKRALEAYWAGRSSIEELLSAEAKLRQENFARLVELGLDSTDGSIPDNSAFYDQVLDITTLLGAIPERFKDAAAKAEAEGKPLDLAFALARGTAENPPQEMTKWFDTNYHYLVPEIGPETPISFANQAVVERAKEAREWGYATRPVLVGPVTYLALAKPSAPGFDPLTRLDDVISAYTALLNAFAAAGVAWVQFDEPAIVSDNLPAEREQIAQLVAQTYQQLAKIDLANRPQIFLHTPYGDSAKYFSDLAATGVEALGIDLVRGTLPNSAALKTAAENNVAVIAGVVDGRNIWRCNLREAIAKLEAIAQAGVKVAVSTTNSLQHVPHDTALEKWEDSTLDENLHKWLAFADQKVAEVVLLAKGVREGFASIEAEVAAVDEILTQRAAAAGVSVPAVRERVAALTEAARTRPDYAQRLAAQTDKLQLPPLPTTTIGSFPQTTEIRKARAAHAKGELSDLEYEKYLEQEINSVIALQEKIGLDVLVHGEAERNDMVQYFAELLDGFAATTQGWVQSYGSRCTRPSILWGDVARSQDLTTRWWSFAQSCTDLPVKGMLTGPVTIIAWSFPRNDLPLGEVADQIALALFDEVSALEAAGAKVIQVDEPALRELLPLEASAHGDYLRWAVGAFRAATATQNPVTQIHTHLCYSEFGQIIDAIAGLDADVTSIEAARSAMEVLPELAEHGFAHQVGPGVWDIHSPRVPSEEEITDLLRLAVKALPAKQLWVNPDCGLKTRGYVETIASLENLVAATKKVRLEIE